MAGPSLTPADRARILTNWGQAMDWVAEQRRTITHIEATAASQYLADAIRKAIDRPDDATDW